MTVPDLLMINRTVKNFPEPCQSGMMGSALTIVACKMSCPTYGGLFTGLQRRALTCFVIL